MTIRIAVRGGLASAATALALLAACAGDPTRPSLEARRSEVAADGNGPESAGSPLSVVFSSMRDGNAEIYRMDADGGDQTRVTSDAASDIEPDMAPNGKRIVFTSARSGNADIWVMDADGANAVNLTNSTAAEGWARWSPNGKRIAFHSNRDGNFELYVVNADGTELTRVTDYAGVDQWPEWSPDGKALAFRRDMDVWVIELRTATLTQLTTDAALDQMAAWSPNGKQLAFMSLRDGYCSVFLMNADGSGQENLTPKDAADPATAWCSRAPSWSTNGQRILFSSRRPGTDASFDIFSMAPDGSDVTRLTSAAGEDAAPTMR